MVCTLVRKNNVVVVFNDSVNWKKQNINCMDSKLLVIVMFVLQKHNTVKRKLYFIRIYRFVARRLV